MTRWLAAIAVLLVGQLVRGGDATDALPTGTAPVAEKSQEGQFVQRTFVDAEGTHGYIVYLPPGYSRSQRWPILLFLHGAGERGTDVWSPTDAGLGPVLRHSPELYPCVIVFPQCETWDDPIFTSWAPESPAGRRALAILDEVERTESIDPQRRSLTGWSMGGFGVTALAAQSPHRWHSALAVAGGFSGASTEALQPVPLWIIHGDNDSIVSVERSRQLAHALGLPAGNSRYDEVAQAGHEVWEKVYSEPRVAQWLLSGGAPPSVDWTASVATDRLPSSKDGAPFVAASTVSQAVTLRIGNDALRMISAGIPESVQPERLQGPLDDIQQTFTIDGETYSLAMRQLTYVARLESAELTALPTAEIRVDLGVSLELCIGQASLKTHGFEGTASPFRIVIGHRRSVPLSVLIKPRIELQKVKLSHREVSFPIPDDNWYVEMPRDIQLSGTKFNRHELETGIVGGLYTRKSEVEEQVRSVIPPLLKRVEQKLNLADSVQATRWLWPFPVYQPRIRWTPESLTVDARGMTVGLGAVIGASHRTEPLAVVPHRAGSAQLPPPSQHSSDLHVTVDPLLMEVVSEEFAASGVARINVLDIPEPRFQALANPERLRRVLPELPSGAEVQTVLALSSAFQLTGEATSEPGLSRSRLRIPQAQLEVFTRAGTSAPWGKLAQFSIALDQPMDVRLESVASGPPLLGLQWLDSVDFKVSTSRLIEPQALQDLESDLRAAWVSWSQSRNVAPKPSEDFVVGDSRLRLESLRLGPQSFDVELRSPLSRITAAGKTTLKYRVRSRNSYWSLPRTLEPGATHSYEAINPLEWQIIGVRGETYSLNLGEVARWDAETGITYDPPRPSSDPPAAAVLSSGR